MPRAGQGWEDTVLEDFPMLQGTANSGAVFGDGDARHKRLITECKDEQGDAIRFPYAHLVKIRAQARRHSVPYWLRFYRNGRGDKVVSMPYELARTLMLLATDPITCTNCKHEMRHDW